MLLCFLKIILRRLPKNIDTRNIWLDLLDLPNTVNGRVCSKHFHPSDFDRKGDGHIWLKPNAHPYQVDEVPKDIAVPNEVGMEDLSVRIVSLKLFQVNVSHSYVYTS